MKLESDSNVWGPLNELSGRDKGRIFAQRANLIVGEALNDPARRARLFRNGVVRRKVLAGDIGCDRSALYNNPEIVQLLAKVEGRGATDQEVHPLTPNDPADEMPTLPLKVQALLDRLTPDCRIQKGNFCDRIAFTDQNCRVGDHRYEFPTIILNGKIELEASDWLRHLVLTSAIETSSAKQYAKVLRAFLRHCYERKRQWFNVDDAFLISWRDGRRRQVDDHQVIYDLTVVFAFYMWAETSNLLSYHVGIYERDELPRGLTRYDFPISAKRRVSRKSGRSTWVSALTFRASKSIEGRRNTPNDEQVARVHEELLKATHGERDALIAAWAEEAGPRRSEILQLRKSDLPTDDQLTTLLEREESWEIKIGRRKRRSKAPLRANPYLLMQTLDWIEEGRREIVSDCRTKIRGYREPDDIFISSTTGKVLTPDSVTKIMGSAFKNAGVQKASLHRLRAKAIVEEIEKHVDAFFDMDIIVEPGSQWAETILVRVAEMAGHASPISLRPYLNFVLARRLSLTEADRLKRRAEKTRHLERRTASAKAWLEKNESIMEAIKLTRRGQYEKAFEILRDHLNDLSCKQKQAAL